MITSLTNKNVKEWMKLKKKKYRDETGLFLVDGWHMVEEALKANLAVTIITTKEDYQSDISVEYVSNQVMEKLSFTQTPQPIMAVCQKQENHLAEGQRYLILDNVQDPGNVGTMMRTALAFGFDQVILSDDSCDLYNDKTLRATQGALFQMKSIRMPLNQCIPLLKEMGTTIIGTSLRNAKSIEQIPSKEKMAFIMGNEGQGIKEDILSLCDQALYIPIQTMESLNVGVASGIIMYTYRGENND